MNKRLIELEEILNLVSIEDILGYLLDNYTEKYVIKEFVDTCEITWILNEIGTEEMTAYLAD